MVQKVYQSPVKFVPGKFFIIRVSEGEFFFFLAHVLCLKGRRFVYVPDLKFSKRVGGSSETEGRDGTLGLGVDGQVMIWCCSSSCGLSTSLYLEGIGRNANELKRA